MKEKAFFIIFKRLSMKQIKQIFFGKWETDFKVGLSPSKKVCVICFTERPLKLKRNSFYLILKALFVVKIFKFISWVFGHAGKTAWLERWD